MVKGKDAPPNRHEPEPRILPADVDAVIPCLRCHELFPSVDHVRNRLCVECERINAREGGTRVISARVFGDSASS